MRYLIFLILAVSVILSAQLSGKYNHPELRWKTLETEHFIFHYHNGTENSTLRFADVGERVYGPITRLYDYEPDGKIHVVVNDYDDTSNGGAYYYTNKMSLWCSSFDTELRGGHYWYANVFTHEFTHMIHLQVSRKTSQYFPGLYLQWTGYETEKREDVLTGFPNVLTSVNIPFNIIPPWFAEGIAQSQDIDSLNYDFWDSSREMVFRERLLSDNELSYDQLLDFTNKSSHEAETIYNTGFAFVQFIIKEYGKEMLYDITKEMSRITSFTFEQAVKRAVGKDAEELYNEWIKSEKEKYREKIKNVAANLKEGKDISDSARVNSSPEFSPDGKFLAFLSTKDNGDATYYRRNIYIKDLETDSITMAAGGIMFSSFSWSPDSKKLYYSKKAPFSLYGNLFYDIYEYDIEKEEEEQVTEGSRAVNPTVSPDGKKIAYTASVDGTRNLYVYNVSSGDIKDLTGLDDGTQYYKPEWKNDGSALLVDRTSLTYGRDVVEVDTLGNEEVIIGDVYDSRDPVYSDDGRYIYYSSDRTGIFNIYRLDTETGEDHAVTNVRGGAYFPEVKDGYLAYMNYHGTGTNIYGIDSIEKIPSENTEYVNYKIRSDKYLFSIDRSILKDSENYMNDFEHILLLPRLAVDDGKFKPGMYFFVNDFLEKVSLFGGFGMAMNQDYDIFAMAEYRFLLPTVYGMGINVEKHDDNSFLDDMIIVDSYEDEQGNDIPIYKETDIDFTYNLKEFDFGMKFPIPLRPSVFGYDLGELVFDGYFAYLRNDAKADYGEYILQYTYFKERSYNFNLELTQSRYDYNSGANPRYGRSWKLHYSRHHTDFIDGFSLNSDYGTLQEDYLKYDYNFYSADLREYFELFGGTGLTLRIKGSYLDDDDIDPFYYNYIGGITGLKGYSFYSIGGTRSALSGIYFRVPVVEKTDKMIGFYNFKSLFAGVFAEAGSAWTTEGYDDLKEDIRKDVGINIRLFGTLFYGFPASAEFTAAYGFDQFVSEDVKYGKEIRTYFTLLFDFPEF